MFLPVSGLGRVNHQTLLWPWMAPIVAMDGSYCGHGWRFAEEQQSIYG